MGTRLNSQDDVLLKSDVFGTITRVGETVVRDARAARPWARLLARHLMRREHRALTRLALGNAALKAFRVHRYSNRPPHAHLDRRRADAYREALAIPAYFRDAARLLRRLHAANVIHNDLAKETQLAGDAGRPPRTGGFPARDDAHEARTAGARRSVTTTSATCSSTSAATCPSVSPLARSAFSPRRRWLRVSGWRAASRSIYLSRGGYSAGAIARAPAIEASARKPAHMRRGRIAIL